MLKELDEDLYIADAPQRFGALEVGARMTIVRLADRRLFVHSPVAATPELVRRVEGLGSVAFLVAPNRFHHLYLAEWQEAFPEARAFVAPGLDSKRPDLAVYGILGDEPAPGWKDGLEQVVVRGLPMVNEVVFLHRASRTLIATDLAFNMGESSPALTRFAFKLLGGYGKLGPSLLERLMVRDRAAFRRSLERILAWEFERVVVAHGEVCEQGGREALAAGYAWLLGEPASS